MIRESLGRRIYLWINAVVLLLVAALCLVPILHVIARSFSKSSSVMAGHVTLFPVNTTLSSYKLLMQRPDFFASFRVSLLRVLLGVTVNMALIMLTAYPLSKKKDQFHGRTAYAWYMILTIIFSGGLIPTYMVVKQMGLINSVWSMVLPGAIPVWNTVLMMNFYRNLPREIEESAFIDGANHLVVHSPVRSRCGHHRAVQHRRPLEQLVRRPDLSEHAEPVSAADLPVHDRLVGHAGRNHIGKRGIHARNLRPHAALRADRHCHGAGAHRLSLPSEVLHQGHRHGQRQGLRGGSHASICTA